MPKKEAAACPNRFTLAKRFRAPVEAFAAPGVIGLPPVNEEPIERMGVWRGMGDGMRFATPCL